MKKIGVVTFHRAENFGSVLQTYALQEFVKSIAAQNGQEIEYTVLDVQPTSQKALYSIYKKGLCVANIIKNSVAFFYRKKLMGKQEKFRTFLNEYVHLSENYGTIDALYLTPPKYDYFISGVRYKASIVP